jgi:hypothetical protein
MYELLSRERPEKREEAGLSKVLGSISQKWQSHKEKGWIFREISVNSTLLYPLPMVY